MVIISLCSSLFSYSSFGVTGVSACLSRQCFLRPFGIVCANDVVAVVSYAVELAAILKWIILFWRGQREAARLRTASPRWEATPSRGNRAHKLGTRQPIYSGDTFSGRAQARGQHRGTTRSRAQVEPSSDYRLPVIGVGFRIVLSRCEDLA